MRATAVRPGRSLAGLAAMLLAIGLLLKQTAFRSAEAQATAHLIGLITSGRARSTGAIIYFGIGTDNVNGMVITLMCSTVILIAPLLTLAGLLLLMPSMPTSRIALGLAIALGIVVASNMLRFAAAASALQWWGSRGFNLVHHWIGSLFVIFGFAAAFILLLVISSRTTLRRGKPAKAGGASHRAGA
jgi:exosortase/archaeosortase family protein